MFSYFLSAVVLMMFPHFWTHKRQITQSKELLWCAVVFSQSGFCEVWNMHNINLKQRAIIPARLSFKSNHYLGFCTRTRGPERSNVVGGVRPVKAPFRTERVMNLKIWWGHSIIKPQRASADWWQWVAVGVLWCVDGTAGISWHNDYQHTCSWLDVVRI